MNTAAVVGNFGGLIGQGDNAEILRVMVGLAF